MKKYIYALGFFDGVHLGHQALLSQCCILAKEHGCTPAAITFDQHPKSLFLDTPPALLSTIPDRTLLLRRYGMESVRVFPVKKEVMFLPWQEFLQILLDDGAAGFVCGDDFHFGYRGEGDAQRLQALCGELGLPCVVIPEQTVGGIRVSSTYIRRQIESGDMATAVNFLGHPHILTGTVVHSQPDSPTASLNLPAGLAIPKSGVYACLALVGGKQYPAVTNIGPLPTVSGADITVETRIPDYEGDLHGREVTLEFFRFLRIQQKFSSPEALQAQLQLDTEETRRTVGN